MTESRRAAMDDYLSDLAHDRRKREHDLLARNKKLTEALEELIECCPNCFDHNCTKHRARAVLADEGN